MTKTNTEITTLLTSRFGNLEVNVVQSGQSEPGITRKQLGEMLGYEKPSLAIKDIHARKAKRLDDSVFCAIVKMPDSLGRTVDTYIYTFKGILEVCRFSNQPNANAVMDWAWETLDRLRKGEFARPKTGTELVIAAMQHLQSELAKETQLRIAAEQKIEEDRDKVAFAETVKANNVLCHFQGAANALFNNGINIGRNRLIQDFRSAGDIKQHDALFTQKALDRKIGQNVQTGTFEYHGATQLSFRAFLNYKGLCEMFDRYHLTTSQRNAIMDDLSDDEERLPAAAPNSLKLHAV